MIRQSLSYPQRLPSSGRTAALLLSMTCLALAGCVETLPKTGNTTAPVTSTAPSAQPSSTQPAAPNLPLQTRSSALPPWRGEWVGTLDCGRGPVQLKFLLFRQQGSRFGVMGEILSIAGKKPSGVPHFTMVGEETGSQLRMRWERWAHQPLSDRTLNFDGEYVTADNTLSLKPLDSACKPLSMRRPKLEEAAGKSTAPTNPKPSELKAEKQSDPTPPSTKQTSPKNCKKGEILARVKDRKPLSNGGIHLVLLFAKNGKVLLDTQMDKQEAAKYESFKMGDVVCYRDELAEEQGR